MMEITRSADRGHAQFGWLDARHSFSFGSYYNPSQMGFGPLRVINEDHVSAANGFGEHGHQDMEILTCVLAGKLAHKDSMGNGSVLVPGDFQRMTAGTGVRHSEMNPSKDQETHLLQIWIEPESLGLKPGYEELHVSEADKRDRLFRVASASPGGNTLKIHRDVDLYVTRLSAGTQLQHLLAAGRIAWIQMVSGELKANGEKLMAGDGAAIRDLSRLDLLAESESELLLFDIGD